MSGARVAVGVAIGVALTALVGALDVVPPAGWAIVGVAALVAATLAALASRARRGSDVLRTLESEQAMGWRDFHRELIRSRRLAHPLALVRIPAAASDPVELLAALTRVRGCLRRADAAWVDGSDVYVMLPETAGEAAVPALARLEALGFVAKQAPRLAVFPVDGLTSGALMTALAGVAPASVGVRGPIASEVVRTPPIPDADDASDGSAGPVAQQA